MEEICVTDMHTGGEPLRIITSGYPKILGNTILDKRSYVRDNLDVLRTRLILEPRGHFDQYGALLVEPDMPDCDIGVLFMHNSGYSTMCGHACIALGRYIVDNSLHKNKEIVDGRYVKTKIQCPCGVVEMKVEILEGGKTGTCSFISVPAFAYRTDIKVATSHGEITFDIGYGGAFYALVDISQTKLSFNETSVGELKRFAYEVTVAVKKSFEINHPEAPELSFLYGTILTDGKDLYSEDTATENFCVFGTNQQVDRSPTGSGVTARLAVQHAKKLIDIGKKRIFKHAITKSEFKGQVVGETALCGNFPTVCIQVEGRAYYTGRSKFIVEENDPFKDGFLIY